MKTITLLLVGAFSLSSTCQAFVYSVSHRISRRASCIRKQTLSCSAAAATDTSSSSTTTTNLTTTFDQGKAVKLAAFSFAVYGEPSGSRFFTTNDGTNIGFQSDEVVRRNFQSILAVNVIRAKGLPKEKNLVDRMFQGGEPDPYPTVEVTSTHGVDRAVGNAVDGSSNPKFINARYFLYVEDEATSKLVVTIKDKNLMGDDDLIGSYTVNIAELFADKESQENKFEGWVELKNQKCNACGRVELEMELIPMAAPEEEEEKEDKEAVINAIKERKVQKGGPKSISDGVDWNALTDKVAEKAVELPDYQLAIFLDNLETDTEAALWVNKKNKELVLSFRGTEITWKDLLTDMLIVQTPLSDDTKDKRLVHTGFRRAFRSIRNAVMTSLEFITGDATLANWSIDVTGHSLGGALAVLMANDLATNVPGLAPRMHVYTYGAPRVGNTAFVEDYDSRLQDQTFRIINNQDVVARVPRATRSPSLIEYDHVGRTVLLTLNHETGIFTVFIEGLDGSCPLRAVDSLIGSRSASSPSIPSKSFELPGLLNLPVSSMATLRNGTSASIGDMLRLASNLTNLQAMMSAPSIGSFNQKSLGQDLNEMTSDVATSSMKGAKGGRNASAIASAAAAAGSSTVAAATAEGRSKSNAAMEFVGKTFGLNASFVDAEMELMQSLIGGGGFADHFEIPYYIALESAFVKLASAGRGAGGGGGTKE